jgi:PST family polysaccharide transporter
MKVDEGRAPSLMANFGALASGHALGIVVPLLTVPYLARVLRPEGWAPVLVAQALASWMVLLLEYGFDLSATRAVAHARAGKAEIGRIVWGVQGAKLLLIPCAVVLLGVAYVFLPSIASSRRLAFWTCVFAMLRGLNPLWYFQGLERVRGAVAVDASSKVAGATGVFLLVHGPADGWIVLALQAAFALMSLVLLTTRLSKQVPAAWSMAAATDALRTSWPLFAFRASSTLYMQANTIILGVFATPLAVAAYGGAERVVRAAINLLEPVTRLLLPRISFLSAANPREAAAMVRKSLLVFGALSACGALLMAALAPLLVHVLLGGGYDAAIPILRRLSMLIPIITVATVLGNFWALPLKRDRALLSVTLVAGAVNLGLAYALVPTLEAIGMASAVVIAEGIVMLSLVVMYWRWRLDAERKAEAIA